MKYPWIKEAFKALSRQLDKMPHALLIHGPAGVGKMALAEHLAQLLLCEAPEPKAAPCGRCDGCRWFSAGNHPDLRRLQPESLARPAPDGEDEEGESRRARGAKPSTEIRVDDVRALAAFLNIGSHRGRRRVALVHPAESMNLHAANSLLKSLEEPPSGAMFILVSHRPARLLPTVRSRCVSVPVARPERQAACAWLESQGIADAERWLDFSGGAPLRALEYGGSDARAQISRLLDVVASGNVEALGTVIEREELERLAEVLQKSALDRGFAASGGAPKYATSARGVSPAAARAWLSYARQMGRYRALARHPLNPRLFAAEMLAAMPKGRG